MFRTAGPGPDAAAFLQPSPCFLPGRGEEHCRHCLLYPQSSGRSAARLICSVRWHWLWWYRLTMQPQFSGGASLYRQTQVITRSSERESTDRFNILIVSSAHLDTYRAVPCSGKAPLVEDLEMLRSSNQTFKQRNGQFFQWKWCLNN